MGAGGLGVQNHETPKGLAGNTCEQKGFFSIGHHTGVNFTEQDPVPSAGRRHEPAVETEKPAPSLPSCHQPVENRTECEGGKIASRRQTRGVQEGEVGKQDTPSFCLEGRSGPWGAASARPAPPLTRDYSNTAREGAGDFRPARSSLRVRVTSPAVAPSDPPPGLSPPHWPPRSCSRLCLPSAPFLLPAVGSRARPRPPAPSNTTRGRTGPFVSWLPVAPPSSSAERQMSADSSVGV